MTQTHTTSERNLALDFTKGALVLFMVLYHWLNYFISAQGHFYSYLRFVTPSFIFIAGFLISNIYLSKHPGSEPRIARRLLQRGLKVFGIFLFLNVAISLLFSESYNGRIMFGDLSLRNMIALYVIGDNVVGDRGKLAAFYILIPISYLLALSAGLLILHRFYRYVFHLACVCFLVGIFILDVNGLESANLELVAVGLLGVSLGCISIETINNVVKHPFPLVVGYLCYLGAVSVCKVTYPLQVIGVCLSLLLIYLLGAKDGNRGISRRQVILVGKYSLLGYIAQIAILQMLYRSLRHVNLGSSGLVVSLLGAFALTIISVAMVDYLRTKSAALNSLYAVVFS